MRALSRRLIGDPKLRGLLYQFVAVVGVVMLFGYLFGNASANMARQNIATGFGYLSREAGFVLSNTPIEYKPSDSYGRALVVGLLNTIIVSALACLMATIIGTVVGILRLSPNALLARLMLVYIEALRNVPLLLYLFFWYAVLVFTLPVVREAIEILPGVFLSNGGLFVPRLVWTRANTLVVLALLAGCGLAAVLARRNLRWRLATGAPRQHGFVLVLAALAPALVVAALLRPEWRIDAPVFGRFRFSGGAVISPEFVALLVGLGLSASASVAELVRSGVQAVGKGQWDAAASLGLTRGQMLRLVILPQTLRIIVPPMTSTYLSITKNSSLAIAIGYPDIVAVSNATMNQTGQAMEAIALFMMVYLTLSILTSLFMNWFNARVALQER